MLVPARTLLPHKLSGGIGTVDLEALILRNVFGGESPRLIKPIIHRFWMSRRSRGQEHTSPYHEE
jgi:hypothetical protein